MKVFAIVSEYNPFHKGHKYQIECIKKEFPDAYIVSVTSGSFVQRGESSFIFKHSKAEEAILNGVDLVIELPTIISLQSADYFSYYSVDLLNKINIVDYISFGVEDMDPKAFISLVNEVNSKKDIIDDLVGANMSNGLSFKQAYTYALEELSLDKDDFLSKPNNILGKKYLDALTSLNSNIKPFIIKRIGPGYHSKEVKDGFESATSIREKYDKSIRLQSPTNLQINEEYINKDRIDKFSSIFYYLAFIEEKPADDIAGYETGLLNLLKNNYDGYLSSTVEKAHNKRYSKSRIKRFLINYILDIKKDDVKKLSSINFIKPLKFNDKGRKLISMIKKSSEINIVYKDKHTKILEPFDKYIWDLDKKAFFLANLDRVENNVNHFTHNPYIK